MVGRERERAVLARALDGVGEGQARFVELVGEPGIGKTRLLGWVAADAACRNSLVLSGRATEFERDAPYGLWVDALDVHLRALEPARLQWLAADELAPLAVALPAFAALHDEPPAAADRYVVHRALRGVLERLATPRPLVLCLDDIHWADPASLDLLAALARRPPRRGVLVAVASREEQGAGALGEALRTGRSERLEVGPLTRAEAAGLCDAGAELYDLSGGNPFYLKQLARGRGATTGGARAADGDAGVPAAVAATLAGELAALPATARRVLEGAAVVGATFEPDLAGEVAAAEPDDALAALDVLLARALIRPAGTPRRFVFRHPLVRHAVYAATPAAWRLASHTRAAAALEQRGAGPVERAQHVLHSARRGDLTAVELLAAASRDVFDQAPASAAQYLSRALELLTHDARSARYRHKLTRGLAFAHLGAGNVEAAQATIADALRGLPPEPWHARARLISLQASIESWAGEPLDEPVRRVRSVLAEAPEQPSLEGFLLRMTLARMELMNLRPERVSRIAVEGLLQARGLGGALAESAALAMLGLGYAVGGRAEHAAGPIDRAGASMRAGDDGANPGPRQQVLWTLGWALSALGRHAEALEWLRQAVRVADRSGHGYFRPVLLAAQLRPLVELGRVDEAIAVGEDAVEAAWATGYPRLRLPARCELALARALHGDDEAAQRDARDAVALAASDAPLWRAKAGSTLGMVLAGRRPDAGIDSILAATGGVELPDVLAAERPAIWAALTEAELRRGDITAARRASERLVTSARPGTPAAVGPAARSRALVQLAAGHGREAADTARRAAAASPPLEAARLRVIEGVARARAGDRSAAIPVLKHATDELERFGAMRLHHGAKRELRELGVRTWRRSGSTARDSRGIEALSAREREVAALVVAGRRNADIAEELFVSLKTVESHTRSLRAKLGAMSRVELFKRLTELRLSAPDATMP